MPNPNYPLVELEKLVEDNCVALERAESLLAALRDQSHAKGDAPVNSQLGEDQDGAPGPKSSPSIQRDSDKRDAWLDLENLAQVEVTSEGLPGWPISSALSLNLGAGWRSKEPGMQTIRLIFAEPKSIQRIQVVFVEEAGGRTQEFVLRWLPKGETAYREIVRQQYVFSPSGSTREIEDYKVDLKELAAVELCIKPDLSAGDALASLAKLRLAWLEQAVLLAEDHMVVRQGLRALVEAEDDQELVGEAETGWEAVEITRKLRPAAVVMDIAMPLLNYLEASRQILKSVAGAN